MDIALLTARVAGWRLSRGWVGQIGRSGWFTAGAARLATPFGLLLPLAELAVVGTLSL